MMTLDDVLEALKAKAVPEKVEGQAAYHKVPRAYLGVSNPDINALTTVLRRELSVEERVA
jgi:hypothetical protein